MAYSTDPASTTASLLDGFGRRITYLRLSVTDRCDLRCRYCMAEEMQFLPRAELLTLDEMALIGERMIARGIRKIRLTGGEPLTRRGLPDLARRLGRHLGAGLDELTMTTNATRLADHAGALAEAGIRRINVSLDTRDPDRFRHITRWGDLSKVMAGVNAAKAAGIAIKINMVALKGVNEDEIADMLEWCGAEGHGLTLIETMPLGVVDEDRTDRYLPLDGVYETLKRRFTLTPTTHRTGGPARYYDVAETGGRLGLITPMTANFCEGCNRIRLTADGRLFMCLGHDDQIDLRTAFREQGTDGLDAGIDRALLGKPLRHEFRIGADLAPNVQRHMSVTGG
jgi:cyclic pyranopterin phosphate synthase